MLGQTARQARIGPHLYDGSYDLLQKPQARLSVTTMSGDSIIWLVALKGQHDPQST
ncbi:hypothetical protein KIN20_002345 [Parelaphostrongylus tenuis]|uniref:Uncharacterized protein n=1 Tax=Parelaphostrongylus tenuis TaxID=148309 RepID=A0AAD5LXK8_PARTN|nr:hypothetical protein KIN20_002345 [Parelaphostrongylus tenuis]